MAHPSPQLQQSLTGGSLASAGQQKERSFGLRVGPMSSFRSKNGSISPKYNITISQPPTCSTTLLLSKWPCCALHGLQRSLVLGLWLKREIHECMKSVRSGVFKCPQHGLMYRKNSLYPQGMDRPLLLSALPSYLQLPGLS